MEGAFNRAKNGSTPTTCKTLCGPFNVSCCSFSEQEVADCTLGGTDTCNKGGEPHDGIVYIAKKQGSVIDTEDEYPSVMLLACSACNFCTALEISTALPLVRVCFLHVILRWCPECCCMHNNDPRATSKCVLKPQCTSLRVGGPLMVGVGGLMFLWITWINLAHRYTSGKSGNLTRCQPLPSGVTTGITGYANVTSGDEVALAQAVIDNTIISVGIDASSMLFQFYDKGIYINEKCNNTYAGLDHGVAVVGFGSGNPLPPVPPGPPPGPANCVNNHYKQECLNEKGCHWCSDGKISYCMGDPCSTTAVVDIGQPDGDNSDYCNSCPIAVLASPRLVLCVCLYFL